MITLEPIELLVAGEVLTVPLPVPCPIRKGSVDVALAMSRGGDAVAPALERSLVVRDGSLPPFNLYARDLRALFPRGAKLWRVVRYAGQVIAVGEIRLATP